MALYNEYNIKYKYIIWRVLEILSKVNNYDNTIYIEKKMNF